MVAFRSILYSVILNLILVLPVAAAEEFIDVTPESSIGLGKFSLRIKVLDPVSQKPWANKPYHFVAYKADGTAATIIHGNTDVDGYGATVYSSQKISHYAAVPKMKPGNSPYTTKMRLIQSDGQASLTRAIYIHFFRMARYLLAGLGNKAAPQKLD